MLTPDPQRRNLEADLRVFFFFFFETLTRRLLKSRRGDLFLSVLQHQVPPGGLVCVSLVPSRPPAETSGRNDVSNQRGLAGTSILIDFIFFFF